MKTPLKPPKRYRKGKKNAEDLKVEEFLSFSSSNYFNIQEDDQMEIIPKCANDTNQIEMRIEDWLKDRNIHKSEIGWKKEMFFEESRSRINSISLGDRKFATGSTISSQLINSKEMSPSSLELTPENSKICQKRSSFASMFEIQIKRHRSLFCNEEVAEEDAEDLPRCRRLHTHSDQFESGVISMQEEACFNESGSPSNKFNY